MQLHSITAVLLNLVLIQEVAAIAAVDTLDNTARAKCEPKPQNCPTQLTTAAPSTLMLTLCAKQFATIPHQPYAATYNYTAGTARRL
ncbi:hypothetical protein EG328_003027 [Venturia inaequalis]|uniref:Uncharacterized protein n=1 Tax=Venturia inaequalis TaxID=5025 RepID=A0A8H3USW1_VENIN|nr:hypothetical protein EG328_003027 [Venturia inaequalis]